jgi:hypothetical protein
MVEAGFRGSPGQIAPVCLRNATLGNSFMCGRANLTGGAPRSLRHF